MSYILEALKKSDAERKRGEVPTLADRPAEDFETDDARKLSPKVLAGAGAALLLAGGLGVWAVTGFMGGEEPTAQTAQMQPDTTQSATQQTPEQPASQAAADPAPQPQPEAKPSSDETPTPSAEPEPQASAEPPAKAEVEVEAKAVAESEAAAQPEPTAPATPEPKPEPEPLPEPRDVEVIAARTAPPPKPEPEAPAISEPTQTPPVASVAAEPANPEPKGPQARIAPSVIKVAPLGSADEHVDRAWSQIDEGQFERAIANLNAAIEMTPGHAGAWFARGWAQEKRGDLDAAIEDYGSAIAAKPNHAFALFSRGYLELYSRRPHDAVLDFVRTQGVAEDRSFRLYSQLWLYLARARSGQDALSRLKDDAREDSLAAWPGPLVLHYMGAMDENAVLNAIDQGPDASRTERRVTGYFFLGAAHALNGNADRARTYFEKALATGAVDFRQYDAAGRELDNLR